jgi:hypothetical protein
LPAARPGYTLAALTKREPSASDKTRARPPSGRTCAEALFEGRAFAFASYLSGLWPFFYRVTARAPLVSKSIAYTSFLRYYQCRKM